MSHRLPRPTGRIAILSLALAAALFSSPTAARAQEDIAATRKVVFQAYWWDCRNDNYPGGTKGGWYTYVAGLVPRLRETGVDAIYLPPPAKGNSGGFSMGYDPFDAYDLGTKDQKGTV